MGICARITDLKAKKGGKFSLPELEPRKGGEVSEYDSD